MHRLESSREAPLSEPPTRPFTVVDPAHRDRGVFVETTGLFAGRPHPVSRDGSIVGRSADCTLRIDDDTLSRVHARVVVSGRDYVLEDMRSLNGCFIGDRPVKRAVLHDGDRIRLGPKVQLRFHLVTEEEERAIVRLYEAGLRDPLTGLANRTQLEDSLRAELSFARRHGTEVSVVMIDVDRFKSVNDSYGHLVGDQVLKQLAQVIASTVRIEDLVARFGGEEFVVVARSIPLAGGQQLAERLRVAIERRPVIAEGLSLDVTASLGVASIACVGEPTAPALIGCADRRLYQAKALGRNRVVAAG